MKKIVSLKFVGLLLIITSMYNANAQDKELPYHQIPDYPEDYSPGNVVARMIDGLGFRFYWATEGLMEKDLAYKPSEVGRTIMETIRHIHGMSGNIKNAPTATPNVRKDLTKLSFEELRKGTLQNLKAASDMVVGKDPGELEKFKVIFQRGEQRSEFPYWNMINGMISDCIYHTGQIVLMRRASGNPQNPNVDVFLGKIME